MSLSNASPAQRNAGSGRESSVAMRATAAALVCGSVALLLGATKAATDCIRDGGATTARPSMILVIIDTLRADRLGTYGYSRATSPRLDAFAKQSVLFENAYSQAPNTPPSVAAILTSLYPSMHHFIGKGDRVTDEARTLPERLGAAGYRTAAFVDGGFLRKDFGLDQGFETYDDKGHGFAHVLPAAKSWIDAHADAPFFVLLHTYDVHTPYEDTPLPYRDAFTTVAYDGDLLSLDLDKIQRKQLARTVTPLEARYFSDLYDGGILHADALLGAFLDDLARAGILDRLLFVVTADHGEEFMEHGVMLHWKLYRTVTHVPLLMRFPGARAGAMRISDIVQSIDIAPTMLDAAGVRGQSGMEGRSLLRRICGYPLHDAVALSEVTWNDTERGYYSGAWHAVSSLATKHAELFDVSADPLEQNNVALRYRSQTKLLREQSSARLAAARARATLHKTTLVAGGVDAKTAESLRALGYVNGDVKPSAR